MSSRVKTKDDSLTFFFSFFALATCFSFKCLLVLWIVCALHDCFLVFVLQQSIENRSSATDQTQATTNLQWKKSKQGLHSAMPFHDH